jgi:hypothetical protein
MSAYNYTEAFKLPARSNGLGRASILRCDHCREQLGLSVHLYWHMQFCSSACVTAYQQRLGPETEAKIARCVAFAVLIDAAGNLSRKSRGVSGQARATCTTS